jgi:hypothetical protein
MSGTSAQQFVDQFVDQERVVSSCCRRTVAAALAATGGRARPTQHGAELGGPTAHAGAACSVGPRGWPRGPGWSSGPCRQLLAAVLVIWAVAQRRDGPTSSATISSRDRWRRRRLARCGCGTRRRCCGVVPVQRRGVGFDAPRLCAAQAHHPSLEVLRVGRHNGGTSIGYAAGLVQQLAHGDTQRRRAHRPRRPGSCLGLDRAGHHRRDHAARGSCRPSCSAEP